jgi:hypothetical protein
VKDGAGRASFDLHLERVGPPRTAQAQPSATHSCARRVAAMRSRAQFRSLRRPLPSSPTALVADGYVGYVDPKALAERNSSESSSCCGS